MTDPVEPLHREETLAQRAYTSLRKAIREQRLVQARVYSEGELARAMNISRTPVREALIELSYEGLVEILPQRGFRLRSLTGAERAEVFALREAVESYVIERAARQARPSDIAALRDLVRRQDAERENALTFLDLDEQFHLLLPTLLGLDRTRQILGTLRGSMWLMGRLALSAHERAAQVIEEHTTIVDALDAGDPHGAVLALRRHLESTLAAAESEARAEAARQANAALA